MQSQGGRSTARHAWPACPPSPPPAPAHHSRTTERNSDAVRGNATPPASAAATPSPAAAYEEGSTLAALANLALGPGPASSGGGGGGQGSSSPTSSSSAHHHPHHSRSGSISTTAASVPVNIPTQALSPPTPAPSPTPTERWSYAPLAVDDDVDDQADDTDQHAETADDLLERFRSLPKDDRFAFLSSLIGELQLNEALVVSSKISPRLKRDFLSDLPIELALHCVSFIADARTLSRAMRVCKYWNDLLQDERLWEDMHERQLYRPTIPLVAAPQPPTGDGGIVGGGSGNSSTPKNSNIALPRLGYQPNLRRMPKQPRTFRDKFRDAYLTEANWLRGGRLLTMHSSIGDSVVTSLVVNEEYIIVGMANSKIHVFDAVTGHYRLSLLGHELGVWALVLVSPTARKSSNDRQDRRFEAPQPKRWEGGSRRASFSASQNGTPPMPFRSNSATDGDRRPRTTKRMRSSDVCGSAASWGGIQRSLVVSGGCDRVVRVWDITTGECVYALRGHSSTIRCLKVLDGRPIAVSGSRDFTLRVWDIDRGRLLRVLNGHDQSVRCIEVAGNQVVSGSYDYTCRLWDIDTGKCLQVFEGHYHQIYAVAFDGERVVSGSLDSTVRVWDAGSGECLAILQGHTSLVGQLQLAGDRLITGGSDGRVIMFDLNDYSCVYRICAHDNSVTCLQFDDRFIVSGGNDGRVKLWDVNTGTFIRELTQPCEAVWRVCFRDDKCAILCQRNNKTVLEVLGFRPQNEELKPGFSRTPHW